jgi:hypothetical protein
MTAMQIEGMICVAQYHGFTIIPVDCSSINNVAPSISMIMEKVTTGMVAILIVMSTKLVNAIKEATVTMCSASKVSHQNNVITCPEKIMN